MFFQTTDMRIEPIVFIHQVMEGIVLLTQLGDLSPMLRKFM